MAAAACRERPDVADLLLWDPVVSGREYLDEHVGTPRPSQVVGLEGFPLSPSLVSALDELDVCEILTKGCKAEVSVLVAQDTPEFRRVEVCLEGRGRNELFEVVPSSGNWAQADPFGDALIPQKIMQAIVDRLTRGPGT